MTKINFVEKAQALLAQFSPEERRALLVPVRQAGFDEGDLVKACEDSFYGRCICTVLEVTLRVIRAK